MGKDIKPTKQPEVTYTIMEAVPGITSRVMGVEGDYDIPGLVAVTQYGQTRMYIGAVSGAFVKTLRWKDIATNYNFEELRHAFVPPTQEVMEAIRKELAKRHGTKVWSVGLIYPIVKELIEQAMVNGEIEEKKGNWLALE